MAVAGGGKSTTALNASNNKTSEFRRSMYDQFSQAAAHKSRRRKNLSGFSLLGIVSEELKYRHMLKD